MAHPFSGVSHPRRRTRLGKVTGSCIKRAPWSAFFRKTEVNCEHQLSDFAQTIIQPRMQSRKSNVRSSLESWHYALYKRERGDVLEQGYLVLRGTINSHQAPSYTSVVNCLYQGLTTGLPRKWPGLWTKPERLTRL